MGLVVLDWAWIKVVWTKLVSKIGSIFLDHFIEIAQVFCRSI